MLTALASECRDVVLKGMRSRQALPPIPDLDAVWSLLPQLNPTVEQAHDLLVAWALSTTTLQLGAACPLGSIGVAEWLVFRGMLETIADCLDHSPNAYSQWHASADESSQFLKCSDGERVAIAALLSFLHNVGNSLDKADRDSVGRAARYCKVLACAWTPLLFDPSGEVILPCMAGILRLPRWPACGASTVLDIWPSLREMRNSECLSGEQVAALVRALGQPSIQALLTFSRMDALSLHEEGNEDEEGRQNLLAFRDLACDVTVDVYSLADGLGHGDAFLDQCCPDGEDPLELEASIHIVMGVAELRCGDGHMSPPIQRVLEKGLAAVCKPECYVPLCQAVAEMLTVVTKQVAALPDLLQVAIEWAAGIGLDRCPTEVTAALMALCSEERALPVLLPVMEQGLLPRARAAAGHISPQADATMFGALVCVVRSLEDKPAKDLGLSTIFGAALTMTPIDHMADFYREVLRAQTCCWALTAKRDSRTPERDALPRTTKLLAQHLRTHTESLYRYLSAAGSAVYSTSVRAGPSPAQRRLPAGELSLTSMAPLCHHYLRYLVRATAGSMGTPEGTELATALLDLCARLLRDSVICPLSIVADWVMYGGSVERLLRPVLPLALEATDRSSTANGVQAAAPLFQLLYWAAVENRRTGLYGNTEVLTTTIAVAIHRCLSCTDRELDSWVLRYLTKLVTARDVGVRRAVQGEFQGLVMGLLRNFTRYNRANASHTYALFEALLETYPEQFQQVCVSVFNDESIGDSVDKKLTAAQKPLALECFVGLRGMKLKMFLNVLTNIDLGLVPSGEALVPYEAMLEASRAPRNEGIVDLTLD